jgi:RHS repeat-associated protein
VENGTTNAYSLGIGNRLSTFGSSGATLHDSAGNITNVTYNDGRELDITWNQRYQVTSISTNGEVAQAFQYDALNRRVSVSDGSTTNFFIYDGLQVIAEADASGTLQKSYTWGPGIDNLLAFTTYTGGETNTYYALTDHLGSVHALVDETGAIVETYRYDAWGRVLGVYDGDGTPIEESAVGNNVLWQGREYSWATGLYFFRARWYDPITGRWLSKDPIGISGGLNQYVFCRNNTVNRRDSFGLRSSSIRTFRVRGLPRTPSAGAPDTPLDALFSIDPGVFLPSMYGYYKYLNEYLVERSIANRRWQPGTHYLIIIDGHIGDPVMGQHLLMSDDSDAIVLSGVTGHDYSFSYDAHELAKNINQQLDNLLFPESQRPPEHVQRLIRQENRGYDEPHAIRRICYGGK